MPRPRIAPGPLHDLKALLYQLYLEAGTPSAEVIAERVRVTAEAERWEETTLSADTARRVLTGTDVPPSQANTVAVAVVLARMQSPPTRDASGPGGGDVGMRMRDLWVLARKSPVEPLHTIEQWNPSDLGVHRAIAAKARSGESQLPPEYFPRDHDHELRRLLAGSVDGPAVMVVLTGKSSTGKTRALYEAVREQLPDWPVLFPLDSGTLKAWISHDAVDAETVLWLDEAHHFLPTAVEELSSLLTRVRPLVVVAATRAEHWERLHTRPEPGQPDALAVDRTRRLLELHHRIIVPDRFTAEQIKALKPLSHSDHRLLAAAKAAGAEGKIIQHLTGGPELARQYDHATDGVFTPLEHAVITAALDARRLGHASAIPASLLAEAAPAYLSDHERAAADPNWLQKTLHGICHDSRTDMDGTLTALQPTRTAPGVGPADGYEPADYLDEHTQSTRRYFVPAQEFWQAAEHYARTPGDLTALGQSAKARLRYRIATRLLRKAADTGDTQAAFELVKLLDVVGDRQGAGQMVNQACDANSSSGTSMLVILAMRRLEAGDYEDAEHLAVKAAANGNPFMLTELTRRRAWSGHFDEAERLARLAGNAGDPEALTLLALFFLKAEDLDRGERLLWEAADAGDPNARTSLAWLRIRDGDWDEAEELARRAHEDGDIEAAEALTWIREYCDEDPDSAEQLARQAHDDGNPHALLKLIMWRERDGDHEGADRLAAYATESSDVGMLQDWATVRNRVGDQFEELRAAYITARRNLVVLTDLATERDRAGDREEAERMARRAAEQGNFHILAALARIREDNGELAAAESLYREAADASSPFALTDVARMLELQGDPESAERIARQSPDHSVLIQLGRIREKAGKRDDAERLYREAAEYGVFSGSAELARLYDDNHEPHRAEQEAFRLVNAGESHTLQVLARAPHRASAPDDRLSGILTRGLEADGTPTIS